MGGFNSVYGCKGSNFIREVLKTVSYLMTVFSDVSLLLIKSHHISWLAWLLFVLKMQEN